ncbi:hypothetical protein BDY24DRAFT_287216 [Mrakia frigida]|uniref:uncharacterized protein n=1 Tax=Mrakia frigida TaxID=29902 RepID=UPI003FCBF66A
MSVSSSSTASLLSVETALQELVQVAGASSSSDSIQNEVNEWVNEFNRLTKSFASPDHRELQELFGEDKIHSIYSAVPLPSLSVTAAFIRAVQNNRLAALLAKPPSQLSAAEQSTKALWEGTICSIVNSVVVSSALSRLNRSRKREKGKERRASGF